MASYPSSAKTFATRSEGQTIDPAHVNDLQDEVTAVEQGLLSGVAHTFKPVSNALYDLGTTLLKWRDLWVSRNASVGGALTVTGACTVSGQLTAPSFSAPVALGLAVNATYDFPNGAAVNGLLQIFCYEDASPAAFVLRGANNSTAEVPSSDISAMFSITAGTANSVNIFWNAGTSNYRIENKRSGSRTFFYTFTGQGV